MQIIGDLSAPTYLEIAGLVSLSYVLVYRPAKFLVKWLANQCQCASKRILNPGPNDYAVVTGATDGIGLEYARQLAEKGYKLVLLSRTEEKLKRVAAEITDEYPQCKQIEIIPVDFSRTDIYNSIRDKLQSLNGRIHVLVNNVGTAYPIPEYFANYPDGYQQGVINTNIVSVTEMSEIVIRIMLKQSADPESKSTAKGVVINISSMAGCSEVPLFSTYSASKAYMNYLSKIMSVEYASDKIVVQTVTPNQVDTKLAKNLYQASMIVNARDFVRYALKTVGTEQQTNAHPKHKLINAFSEWFGGLIGDHLFMKLKLKYGKALREEYEQKVRENPENANANIPLVN